MKSLDRVKKIETINIEKVNASPKRNGTKPTDATQIPVAKAIERKKIGGGEIKCRSKTGFSGTLDEFNIRKMIHLFLKIRN